MVKIPSPWRHEWSLLGLLGASTPELGGVYEAKLPHALVQ